MSKVTVEPNTKRVIIEDLSDETIKLLLGNANLKKLGDIQPGDIANVGKNLEFIVLKQTGEETHLLLKDFWKTAMFDDDSNDYRESDIRKSLNTEFYEMLSNAVGKENIVSHTVDLTADDGRVDYQSCTDNISLLTCDMYRQNVYLIDRYRINKWWMLATPYSTKSNGYEKSVRCVYLNGTLDNFNCDNCFGVRPFCILKSNIFVSE